MTPPADLEEYLRAQRVHIDAALDRALPTAPGCPAVIAEAMRYSVFAGGKRVRPILTLAAAEAVAASQPSPGDSPASSPLELALPAACAIELIHTYSLIHDDLPAMDDDTLRRGRPTAHVVYGEGIAILAGDGLLTEAFGLLARNPETEDPVLRRRKLRALACVAEAAGASGMVGGQAIDLQVAGRTPQGQAEPLSTEDLRAMHRRKTGALIRAATVTGAIMVGGSSTLIEAIDAYASHLGLAFQIVDDILDVEGAATELGKTAGKDAAAGKPTYPSVYGLEGSRRLADQCVTDAQAALGSAQLGGRLVDIAEWVRSRNR